MPLERHCDDDLEEIKLAWSVTSNGPKYIGFWLLKDIFRRDIKGAWDLMPKIVLGFIDPELVPMRVYLINPETSLAKGL